MTQSANELWGTLDLLVRMAIAVAFAGTIFIGVVAYMYSSRKIEERKNKIEDKSAKDGATSDGKDGPIEGEVVDKK